VRDERLVPETRRRIDNRDYEAVFAHGGCFHFALRLHEKVGYKIRGIREGNDGTTLSHVWCRKAETCMGVDIRGVCHEDLLVQLANGGSMAVKCDVSVEEVRDMIRSKEYPSELEAEIRGLADWILDKHERFAAAKPVDENLYRQFVKDIESECDGNSPA